MIDLICQIGIIIFGISAAFLMAFKNKLGVVFGFCSQPFWITTSYMNDQFGVFLLSLIYTVTWVIGIYNWWIKPMKEKNERYKRNTEECKGKL